MFSMISKFESNDTHNSSSSSSGSSIESYFIVFFMHSKVYISEYSLDLKRYCTKQ